MNKIMGMTRRPWFWGVQVLVFLICSAFAIHYYPKAFPVVDLEIKMDRSAALKSAAAIAQQHQWLPENFKQAARFDLDEEAQTFIELTAGGSPAFAKVLKEGLYYPYTWQVRNYAEGNTRETQIHFTPQGDLYEFSEKLSENDPGAALSVNEAQKIAEDGAKSFGVHLAEFQLVEKSQEIKPSHRVDHSFVYERPNIKVGEGTYRLNLIVAGNRLVRLSHFIKIPDAFIRRYAEMRSSNDTISVVSSAAIAILYFFGGCVLGLFFLSKMRWVQWRKPFLFALIVGSFQFLEQLNHLPLIWMDYDTALSSAGFLTRHLFSSLGMLVFEVIMLTVSFAAAESLSRRAYPHHPQLWKLWTLRNASSYAVLGRTLSGYLSVGFFFCYIVVVYILGSHYLGWWSPSDTLFHPDVLATYCPWFTSISNSLHAGFWEESLFRAVPLACAALLGNRFGGRKKWITLGFLIQALVFASAHANYPAQPSYARVVELILPSMVFGGFYLVFGLLPGILLHFIFDTVSFALPLFAAQTPGIWVERGMVILVALVPLWIVLFARLKTRQWLDLPASEYNGAWKAESLDSNKAKKNRYSAEGAHVQTWSLESFQKAFPYAKPLSLSLSLASLVILVGMLFYHFENQSLRLEVGRQQAISIARKALEKSGFPLSPSWIAGAIISEGSEQEEDFVWRTGGLESYRKLLGTYLPPPGWVVRFFRFDTDVAERAEEFQVSIYGSGEIYRIRHEVPEARAIPSLSEEDAKKIALGSLQKIYGIHSSELTELSSTASRLQTRTDWYFVFSNPQIHLTQGEARIAVRVIGNEVGAVRRYVFIPEEWARQERNRQNGIGIVRGFSGLMIALILVAGIGISLKKWVQHRASFKTFWQAWMVFLVLECISFFNGLPPRLAQFSTESPRVNQFISLYAWGFIQILFISGALALVAGHVVKLLRRQPTVGSLGGIRIGYSVGIVGAFMIAGVSRLLPPLGPMAGKLDALNGYIPGFYSFRTLIHYVGVSLFFILIGFAVQSWTHGWKVNRVRVAGLIICLGFILTGVQAEELSHWLIMGAWTGLVLLLGYRFFLKTTLNLIPLAIAGVFILVGLREFKLNAYLGSTWITGVSLLLLVGVSSFLASYIGNTAGHEE